MKDFEREEANIAELEQIGEFASFPAEEFSSNELFLNKNEEYKVKEIQPQSFVDNEEITKKTNKNNNAIRDKLNKHLYSSSGATASSVSVATVTVTAAIATGIVVTPLFANYGNLTFNNYQVEVYKSSENETDLLKGVYLYFDEELEEGFNAQIINKQTSEVKELDKSLDYVYFESLTLDIYKFEVQILDKNNKIENSYYIKVETKCEIDYNSFSDFEHLITYNLDNTTNLYYYPLLKYSDEYNIKNKLEIFDNEGNTLEYNIQTKDDLLYIENIKEKDYSILFSSYLLKNGNSYLINNNVISGISPYTINWTASIDKDELQIEFIDEPIEDIKIKVEYLDLDLFEEFTLTQSFNILQLSQISESLKLTITGEFNKNNESKYIEYYQGDLFLFASVEEEIYQEIRSEVQLLRLEHLNYTYSPDYSSTPTNIYFEGYLKDGDYLNVYVYDNNQSLIESKENINDLNQLIQFLDLDSTQELTLEYKIFDSQGSEISTNNYQFTTALPEKYQDVTHPYSYSNPSDIYLTYNDDSFNAYINMNPSSSEKEYDVYYKINIKDGSVIEHSVLSNEDISVIEDIKYGYYGLAYAYFVKDGLNYYAIANEIVPSGTVGLERNEEGYFEEGYLTYSSTDNLDVYEMMTTAAIHSDLEVNVLLDNNQEIKLTIPLDDITANGIDSIFYLDLSSYEYSEAYVEIVGLLNCYDDSQEEITSKIETKGNQGCQTILNTTIYK